jgi:hypothetical protein
VAHGTEETYFVAIDLAAGAGSAVANTLIVTHLTESSSTDIPLGLEFLADTSSTPMTVQQTFPEITVTPTVLIFGFQDVAAGATAAQAITIINDGTADLNISGVSLVGDDLAEFLIAADTGEAVLAPLATRTVMVSFDPSSLGLKSADLRVLSDDSDEPMIDVALNGGTEMIFADGFESGDTSAWSNTVP